MCTRYISPETADLERLWHVGNRTPLRWPREVFPRYLGPFIRRARDSTEPERELKVGQWMHGRLPARCSGVLCNT